MKPILLGILATVATVAHAEQPEPNGRSNVTAITSACAFSGRESGKIVQKEGSTLLSSNPQDGGEPAKYVLSTRGDLKVSVGLPVLVDKNAEELALDGRKTKVVSTYTKYAPTTAGATAFYNTLSMDDVLLIEASATPESQVPEGYTMYTVITCE